MKKPPYEIRLNDDGTLDEVVADKCFFHLEQMAGTHWWIGVTVGDVTIHINLHSKATIKARADT